MYTVSLIYLERGLYLENKLLSLSNYCHSSTSALLQLTSDVATGFNQRKLPHRTICVAVDLTVEFDTVNHIVLLSKIARSTLPEAKCRWLSNYIRGRQSVTNCMGVKSKSRIIHTGVPQCSKLSPTLFSFYIAYMPRLTKPVRRICYADDITMWASGVKIKIADSELPLVPSPKLLGVYLDTLC